MDLDNEAGEEAGETQDAAVDISGDSTLGDVFTNATKGHSPLDAEEETPAEGVAEPAQQETPDDNRLTALEQRLQEQNDRLIELQTQNNILRHQQGQREQQQLELPIKPAAADEDFADLDTFRRATAADPAAAIFKLFQQANKATSTSTQEAVNQARTEAVNVMQRQKLLEQDQASTVAQFGQMMRENKEFAQLSETIYARMTADGEEIKPGLRWKPGMMQAAASVAFAQMVQAGTLRPNAKVVNMKERKPTPPNPLVGDTRADKPRSIASDIPPDQLRIMSKTAKDFGLSLDDYLKIYNERQKQDPSFGRG